MDDTELLAAIGRIVVNAALLEYSVAELVAVIEGLRGEACQERAVWIASKAGRAMILFERASEHRPDLVALMQDTRVLLQVRHFVAHSVAQEDAVAEGLPALFVLQPRHGETMITTELARSNARMIRRGVARIQKAVAEEIAW